MPQHHNANKGNRTKFVSPGVTTREGMEHFHANPNKLQETIQVLGSRLQHIWELVQVHPNDQELGKEIRRYINALSEEAKNK